MSRIRNVSSNQIELFEFHCQNPSLLWMLLLNQIFLQRYRKILRENCHSRITCWTFTKVPITMVTLQLYLCLVKGFLINFCFVDANYIRLRLDKIVLEFLLIEYSSYSIDIPRRDKKLIRSLARTITPLALTWLRVLNFIAGKLFGLCFGNFRLFFFHNFVGEKFDLLFLGWSLLQRGRFLWRHLKDFNVLYIGFW